MRQFCKRVYSVAHRRPSCVLRGSQSTFTCDVHIVAKRTSTARSLVFLCQHCTWPARLINDSSATRRSVVHPGRAQVPAAPSQHARLASYRRVVASKHRSQCGWTSAPWRRPPTRHGAGRSSSPAIHREEEGDSGTPTRVPLPWMVICPSRHVAPSSPECARRRETTAARWYPRTSGHTSSQHMGQARVQSGTLGECAAGDALAGPTARSRIRWEGAPVARERCYSFHGRTRPPRPMGNLYVAPRVASRRPSGATCRNCIATRYAFRPPRTAC